MTGETERIVTELPQLENVTGVTDAANLRLAQGDVAFVTDLGIELARRHQSAGVPVWQYPYVFDHLFRILTSAPGPGRVEAALRLIGAPAFKGRRMDRRAASFLAAGRPAEDLAAVFTGGSSSAGASEELRVCLLHELVLRGVPVTEVPGIARWATSPHWRHHPLGWLPLTLSAMEAEADLPAYGAGGECHSLPYGPFEGSTAASGWTTPVPYAVDVTPEAAETAMRTAVANWAAESNGRIEAGIFEFDDPLRADAVPSALASLGLECLAGLDEPRATFSAPACRPRRAWRVLFAAASSGGAYGSGRGGAYGRLAAWQSMAGLAQVPTGAPAEEVEARVAECSWYGFSTTTDWFEQVIWDIGLAALAPDGRRPSVLAATDTD